MLSMWTITAFILQKLSALNRISVPVRKSVQFITEVLALCVPCYMVVIHDWVFSNKMFVCFQAFIHFMKMHSYNATNNLLREEHNYLKKHDKQQISDYPLSINFKDFGFYLLCPTLVYWSTPPKTNIQIRWRFIFSHAISAVLCLVGLYIIATTGLYSIVLIKNEFTYLQSWAYCVCPSMAIYVLLFIVTFECSTNIYAELYRFPYRHFYGDWWNCVNYYEFAKKWNRMVHEFLFRHVFLPLIHTLKVKKWWGYFWTIMLSAVLHQVVACVVLKRIFIFYFFIILWQIPSSYILDFAFKNYSFPVRNLMWWIGLFWGNGLVFSHMLYYYI